MKNNNKTLLALFTLFLITIVVGCAQQAAEEKRVLFDEGIQKLSELDEQFGTGMVAVPKTMEEINNLYAQLLGYQASKQFDTDIAVLLNYRLKVLEAKIKFEEGWKHGKSGTTEFGIACNAMYDKVIESSVLRNESANIGNEAVKLLQEFIDTYPEKAKNLNLTQRDVLFLKTTYFEIGEKAQKDNRVIISLCKDKIDK